MSAQKYKKRPGTSGIRGHLYESKLISLVYFRAKHNASVRNFLLATNMDKVGAFDDICLRVKIRGFEKPLVVFVQAKHRENDNSVLTLTSKHDLSVYFYSYLNIRRAFTPQAKGELFEGSFDTAECLFVMYTTAKYADSNKAYESPFSKHLNGLIATGKNGIQPQYKQKDVEFLSNIVIQEQVTRLAELLAKFICEDDDTVLSMNNELMPCYHVILAQKVLNVSNIQLRGEENEHRVAGFRQDFFTTNDEFLKLFKDTLVIEILKNKKLEEHKVNVLLTSLLTEPFDILVLSELIVCVVTYSEGKLRFVQEMDEELKQRLFNMKVSQATVEHAIEMAAQRMLFRKTFKVPVAFGNNDLKIRGKVDVDIEHVLNGLSSKIVGLLRTSDPANVIIDDTLGNEFLQLNQGIASAVGNILIRDESTNSMMFTDEHEALGDLAKRLFGKVRHEIQYLHPYRFVVRTKRFPLLSFNIDEDGRNMEQVKQEITTLAVTMAKFLNEEVSFTSLMDDELVFRYHVILEQIAIDVSDIQQRYEDGEHRIASFRQELFDTDDELLKLFIHTLYIEILKRRKLEEHEIGLLLAILYKDPSDICSLGKLIGNVVTYENGKLQFVYESSENFKEQLNTVNITPSSVDEAIELAAKEILLQKQFKVPAAFGNKDLTIKGQKGLKIESRLNHLKTKISELNDMKIVTIDDNLGDELLREGLAGAVGNILVLDKETNLLKFVDDNELLGQLSGMLFRNLESKIPDLQQYRFDAKVKWIPKFTYNFEDEDNCDIQKKEMSALAELFADYLCRETDCVMSMADGHMSLYHVILAENAIDVSDIQQTNAVGEHRIASFRKDFFETNEKLMKLLKDRLYLEIVKRRTLEENELMTALTTFFQFPSDVTVLSKLIGNVVIFKHGKLQFVHEVPEEMKKQLNKVSVTQVKVSEAIELAAKEILTSKQFKVPIAFGNKDLTIRDKSCNATEVLNHLTLKVCELVNSPDVLKIATIDESLGDGLLNANGGIGGLVGNLLVHDENTKLLKFVDNSETLEELSRRLFNKLSQNGDMRQYRFVVKAKKFPKLTFDSSDNDRRLVEDFLNRLLFFTSQADETRVGDILKGDIEDQICRNVNNFRVTSDALFLKYHDEIQTWWMDVEGDYLTKKSQKYEIAIKKIVSKPLMTVLGMMHQTRIGNNIDCTFNDKVINALTLTSGTVIVTDSTDLTVAKMIQRYKSQDHVVLDLEYVLNLQANEYNTLCEELRDTDKKKMLIVVCNHKPSNRNWSSRLKNITEAVNDKNNVVVTNKSLVEFIKEYFVHIHDVVDDKISNLADLTAESQKSVLKNATVLFQGKEVSLELILDEGSMRYVKGNVLNKVINNELMTVSKLEGSFNYDKIKTVFLDREVRRTMNPKRIVLNSLDDLSDDVIILTAQPGMGKSTMLTYLSHKAKEIDPKLWIVRVNLLDHSEQFNNWKDHKTDIDILESLVFLGRVALSEDTADEPVCVKLEESGGFVYLRHWSGDESTAFELEMFLHFYNTKTMMFLFDGFDEICPHYAQEAMALFKTVRSFPKKHKMWITSRSYDEVKSILEIEFGPSFEMQNFSYSDRNRYLDLFWKKKIDLTRLNYDQLNNLINFMTCVTEIYAERKRIKLRHKVVYLKVCMSFRRYLAKEIHKCPPRIVEKFKELLLICNYDIIFEDNFDSPLHLYLVADYLRNQILKYNDFDNNWNLNDNALSIYERFFEAKLKWIRFEEKNKILLSNSDNIIIYEHIREDFFKRHRQLGAYAIFHQDAENIFSLKEMREIIDTMVRIKAGKEKTGVICGVSNDVPIFIHMIFAEYFAVQHLCYILMTENEIDRRRSIWDFILNVIFLKCSRNVRELLEYRIQLDDSLKEVIRESEFIIFDLLLKQGKGIFTYYEEDVSEEIYLKIKAYLKQAMDSDLVSFISILYKIKKKLTGEYLADNTRTPTKVKRYKLNALIRKKKSTLVQSDEDKSDFRTLIRG